MQLDDYFEYRSPNEIKIKGHRIWIEDVLYEYIYREQTPDELAKRFPSLSLEQIHATILYYLRNREQMDLYLTTALEVGRRARAEQETNPLPVVIRLRALRSEHETASAGA
jgi:uncharacterized protein (DUF433 family)